MGAVLSEAEIAEVIGLPGGARSVRDVTDTQQRRELLDARPVRRQRYFSLGERQYDKLCRYARKTELTHSAAMSRLIDEFL